MTETGLSKVSGQIVTIDHQNRAVAIRDKESIITSLHWNAGLDTKMGKLKEKYFTSFIFVGELIEDTQYFPKPADWPVQQGNKPPFQGKPYQKQDPAAMVVLALHKNYTSMLVSSPGDFDNERDLIMKSVEEDAPKLMALIKKLGGQ